MIQTTTEEVFTPDELAAADPRDINYLLASRAYTEFYEPLLIGIIQRWLKELADPSLKRHWEKPDDYLRGGIRAVQAILNFPGHILQQQTQRNREEERDNNLSQRYQDVAVGGRGPYGEAEAPFSPSDPI